MEGMTRLMEDEREGCCTGGNCAGHGLGVSEGEKRPGNDDGAALFPLSSIIACCGVLPNLFGRV